MKKALIFPGQGSQFVGMGKDLYENFASAKEVFQEVDDTLNQKLSNIIFEGPMDELTMTANTQPALMAVSMAIVRILTKEANIKISELGSYVAGHSLGEYTALAAAGTFSIAQVTKLLRIRGASMQEATPKGMGGMAAILGATEEEVKIIVEEAAKDEVCQLANDNSPGQIVISGHIGAIDRAVNIALGKSKKAIKLPVSAPFHCSLMKFAQDKMFDALSKETIKMPLLPLIANVTAKEVLDPQEIKNLLVEQVVSMVRWRESIEYLRNKGVNIFIEIGAGKVLSGLTKRIDKEAESINIQSASDIEELLKKLS